ncbi:MAG: cytoplasmic protein [Demequina sp.]|nr:cytoplasmic protein [Demequina sp.]
MSPDPVATNPKHYSVVFENERVRVLKYHDEPGTLTLPHDHPDSVMITASSFRRELIQGERKAEVDLPAGRAVWLAAQSHAGHNIGETDTDVFFVELKEPAPAGISAGTDALGPNK